MWTTHNATYTEDETTHGGEDGQHDGHPAYRQTLPAKNMYLMPLDDNEIDLLTRRTEPLLQDVVVLGAWGT